GQRGDTPPAIRAALQVTTDRLGRGVVEPARAVGEQGLVGRMQGGLGVHEIGLRVKSGHARRAVPQWITKALVTKREDQRVGALDATQHGPRAEWAPSADPLARKAFRSAP